MLGEGITSGILEIEELAYLEELSQEYQEHNGFPPFDLSHWDPSDQVETFLLKHLRLPQPPSAARYIHSHYIDVRQQILGRLGLLSKTEDCVLVNSGTNAILFAIGWLKELKIKDLIVICPVYFPVFYASHVIGLPYAPTFMRRESGRWFLPVGEILNLVRAAGSNNAAVWVTNPVFCSGEYLREEDFEFLDLLLAEGVTVVADECLAANGYELGRRFGWRERFLGLYSPHKSICINAAKFSAIAFNVKHQRFFDHFTDVFAGGLSGSSYTAIMHFLGDNFPSLQSTFLGHMRDARERTIRRISRLSTRIDTDRDSIGHFISCYFDNIPAREGKSKPFLRDVVSNTGAIVIPGIRNYFTPSVGFSFRINLARECPQFSAALHRILDYLAHIDSSSTLSSR